MRNGSARVDRLLADEPALASMGFGPFVAQGIGVGPAVLIGDASEIGLMRSARNSYLDHRMAHLAKSGDIILLHARDIQFETYLRTHRGMGAVTVLAADAASNSSIAEHALNTPRLLQKLITIAQFNKGLTLTAYLTTGTIWHLAQVIGEAAGCVVHVNGPSPRVSKRANDKLWFAGITRTIIGNEAVPPTMAAYGPKAAVAKVMQLGKQGERVIVKVPDSAGSAGNIRLDQDTITRHSADHIQAMLLDRLHGTGWHDDYPILVGVWDANVTFSPSVQLFIPLIEEGPPVVQAVFEQQVFGASAAFVGAAKSTLPDELQQTLGHQAIEIAQVLQRLGYFGRCSFDAVICGDNPGKIHWIECNGRWGGVSIPLAVLSTICAGQLPDGIVIIQEQLPGEPISTQDAIARLGDLLYRGSAVSKGVVLMSPPINVLGPTANLVAFAPSPKEAVDLGAHAMGLLKGEPAVV